MDELNSKVDTSEENYWTKRSKETLQKEAETDNSEITKEIQIKLRDILI